MKALNSKPKKVSPEKAVSADAGMDYLARLLTSRERSCEEVRKRLLEKGYTEDTVSEVIERACACALLDDNRFAENYIKDKLALRWGKRRIERELFFFGIKTETIPGYPEEFFSESEQLENALAALERHHSRSKNPRQAAYRFLLSKGYSSSIASAALKQLEEQNGAAL